MQQASADALGAHNAAHEALVSSPDGYPLETDSNYVSMQAAPEDSAQWLNNSADKCDNQEQEKADWVNSYVLLGKKVEAMEKEFRIPWDLVPDALDTRRLCRECDNERIKLSNSLKARTSEIKSMLTLMQQKLVNVKPGSRFIEDVTQQLQLLETELYTFRETERTKFEALLTEEHLLTRDLELFCERLQGSFWSNDKAEPATPAKSDAIPEYIYSQRLRELGKVKAQALDRSTEDSGLAAEVQEFDAFVEKYGTSVGWIEQDHRHFVRILEQCRGDFGLAVSEATDRIPGYSRQEIIKHARLYHEYMELEYRKKNAIQEWRTRRTVQDTMNRASGLSTEASIMDHSSQQRHAAQERAYRETQREAVALWRMEREEQTASARALEQDQNAHSRQRSQREARRRQEYNKSRLELYRMQKDAESGQQQTQQGGGVQHRVPAAQWKQIQERNRQMLQKKQELKDAKQLRLRGRSKSRSRTAQLASRDPNRLLQPTKATQSRLQAKAEEEANAMDSQYISNVQKKAQPLWREPLTAL